MMKKETLFEKIGYYWGMSNRKFSSLSEKELQYYQTLATEVLNFEAGVYSAEQHEKRAEVHLLLPGTHPYQNAC